MPTLTPFHTLIADARSFFTELSAHNNRDWFLENKARYEAQLKTPALALLDAISPEIARLTGQDVESKLFRPHRDVRFSKDKTPYKTHLHMLWATPGAKWFFGISTERVTIGGGRMGFSKDAIDAWRLDIDGRPGAAIADELAGLAADGFRISTPELKRIPAPFNADHPRADLLRHKSLSVWHDITDPPADIVETLRDGFARILPLQKRLARMPD